MRPLRILFFTVLLVGVTLGSAVAVATNPDWQPEMFRRFGSLLCAFGAILVICQVVWEIATEQHHRVDLSYLEEASPANREYAIRLMANKEKGRHNQRLAIVTAIAILIFTGEVVHGWGDMIYEYLIKTSKLLVHAIRWPIRP